MKLKIEESRKPKYWNTAFATKVIDAYNDGSLTLDNISDWETEYNDGVKPNKDMGTRDILKYYTSTKKDPRNESNPKNEDVNIEVKNKGILEVPEGKNVDDLPMSHFEKLVKKHGLSKITKALNNLQVWNKNDDKKLSKWAGNMIDKLTKKYGKDESISVKRFNEGWHNGDAIITFTHNDDLEADLEEFLFDLFSDNPDVFEFDWSGKNTILYLACSKDDYDYIEWFINDWKYKHRDEYDESLKEYYDTQDFDRGTEDMFNYDGSDMNDEVPEDSEYEEDGLYEYELAIPRSSMNEFAEFVADLFGERLEDIKNNDSEHVWVLSVDKSRDEVIVKCVCTEKEFKEIDRWAWR